jgi:integrase
MEYKINKVQVGKYKGTLHIPTDKKTDNYYLHYRLNKKLKKKSTKTTNIMEARRIAIEILKRVEIENYDGLLLFDLVTEWKKYSDSSEGYKNQVEKHFRKLIKFFGNISIDLIDKNSLLEYKQSLKESISQRSKKPLSPTYRRNNLNHIKVVFRWGNRYDKFRSKLNSFEDIKFPPAENKIYFLSLHELLKVKQKCKKKYPLECLYTDFLIISGWRIEELHRLQWHEIDTDGKRIFMRKTKTGSYYVKLRPKVEVVLNKIKKLQKTPHNKYVVVGVRFNERVGLRALWSYIKKCLEYSGFPEAAAHTLRHSFCTNHIIYKKTPITDLKALARHKSITTTMKYVHLASDFHIKDDDVSFEELYDNYNVEAVEQFFDFE